MAQDTQDTWGPQTLDRRTPRTMVPRTHEHPGATNPTWTPGTTHPGQTDRSPIARTGHLGPAYAGQTDTQHPSNQERRTPHTHVAQGRRTTENPRTQDTRTARPAVPGTDGRTGGRTGPVPKPGARRLQDPGEPRAAGAMWGRSPGARPAPSICIGGGAGPHLHFARAGVGRGVPPPPPVTDTRDERTFVKNGLSHCIKGGGALSPPPPPARVQLPLQPRTTFSLQAIPLFASFKLCLKKKPKNP